MKLSAIVLTAVFLCAVGGTQYADAVGFERHVTEDSSALDSKAGPQNGHSFVEALKKAAFVEKIPEVIDQVAGFVKDVFGQFGLRTNRNQ